MNRSRDQCEEPLWAEVLEILYKDLGEGSWKEYLPPADEDEITIERIKKEQARHIARRLWDEDYRATSRLTDNLSDKDVSKVERVLDELVNIELIKIESSIEENPSYSLPYKPTRQGFEVAHDRIQNKRQNQREKRRARRQHSVNRAVGFLTLGLVLIGFIQSVVTAMVGYNSPLWQANVVIIIGLLMVGVIVYLLKTAGMLSKWHDKNDL